MAQPSDTQLIAGALNAAMELDSPREARMILDRLINLTARGEGAADILRRLNPVHESKRQPQPDKPMLQREHVETGDQFAQMSAAFKKLVGETNTALRALGDRIALLELRPDDDVQMSDFGIEPAATTLMRRSAGPCAECGDEWSEPMRRGRLPIRCPICRDDSLVAHAGR